MLFSVPLCHKVMQECEQNLNFKTRLNILSRQIIGQIKTKNNQNNLDIPPPSVPKAAEHSPAATIAAEPDEDPPVYLSGACGFLVVLQ